MTRLLYSFSERLNRRLLLESFVAECSDKSPTHGQRAAQILRDKGLPENLLHSVMASGVDAAIDLAKGLGRCASNEAEATVLLSLKQTFGQVAALAKHGTSEVRSRLDQAVAIQASSVEADASEVLLELLKQIRCVLDNVPAKRLGGVMRELVLQTRQETSTPFQLPASDYLGQYFTIIEDFESLGTENHADCVEVFKSFDRERSEANLCAALFDELTSLLATKIASRERIHIRTTELKIAFVQRIARAFKDVGLGVGRGTDPTDNNYRSPFHAFCEYVATAVLEPWTARHNEESHRRMKKAREEATKSEKARLSKLDREPDESVKPEQWIFDLQQSDQKWLITAYIVREAMRNVKLEPTN